MASPISVNWKLCILCQLETNELLQCPANSRRNDVGAGYKSLAQNIKSFQDLGEIPLKFDSTKIDDGSGVENSLSLNKALWHKSCRNKFNTTELNRVKKRKSSDFENDGHDGDSPCKTRKATRRFDRQQTEFTCFFCDKSDSFDNLHSASTDIIDKRVKECALQLRDRDLLAKLAGAGDMVALEAKYHSHCLASLYNRCRTKANENCEGETEHSKQLHGIVFAEVISYMEDFFEERDINGVRVLKLSDLVKMYQSKFDEYGVDAAYVHSTRLKERILSKLPYISAYPQKRDILFVLDEEVGNAIRQANEQDNDAEAMHLFRAAKIVRKEILKQEQVFKGQFDADCQEKSIPQSLKALIYFITKGLGPKGKESTNETDIENESQATRSISQLIMYNTTVRQAKTPSASTRHCRERETPLPIYVALKIHGLTRGRNLIDTLFGLGMCISYDRVLTISTDLANSVCERFEKDGVVCPPILKDGIFTTAGFDNLDHNPSSTTATDSFHGTAISLVQHPTEQTPGTTREKAVIDGHRQKDTKISSLPSQFTDVQPLVLVEQDLYPPAADAEMPTQEMEIEFGFKKEVQWLDNAKELVAKGKLDQDDNISWAAYHASNVPQSNNKPAVTSLMPLFLENAHSAPMIFHGMNVIRSAVELVNPGQTAVIAMDQPLFALAKQIQWQFPQTHGEDKFLIMFGGLHIELAALRALGKFLDKSGWTTVLVNAGVASSGVADSFTSAKHITRTRKAHQITSAALYILQQHAYEKYIASGEDRVPLNFTRWVERMSGKCPHFLYWLKVMNLQLLFLQLVKAFRTANFKMYVDTLIQLMPLFFALDQTHYSRWLSIHIRDMQELSTKHPYIYKKFTDGFFTVHKTEKPFSAMALDQAHEQENALVKGEGGAVGLTDNPGALKRWMISGPEIARIVQEFEVTTKGSHKGSLKHHEQSFSHQSRFFKDIKSVIDSFEELGNPFEEKGQDLLSIDTKDIMNNDVVEAVKNVEKIGQEQYLSYVDERLKKRTVSISEPIKMNKLASFSNSNQKKTLSKDKSKIVQLKNDRSLFLRLYMACQNRDGNLEEFFQHENQPWPPSLADGGVMRKGQKADLVKCLEDHQTKKQSTAPIVDSVIIDGAVVVNMLSPKSTRTFQDYSDMVFKPYVIKQVEKVTRVDVVWDVYKDSSLKEGTRETRGKGIRRRVLPSTNIPRDWQSFLRVNENKVELFHFLSEELVSLEIENKDIYTTFDEKVLHSGSNRSDLSEMDLCTHEEADTRVMLHAKDAASRGNQRIMIRSNDTDVVVLAIFIYYSIRVSELWLAYGTGKNFRYIAVHEIANSLGENKSKALPLFHAMTGCDTVSFLAGKGKKTSWQIWKLYPELTSALVGLMSSPPPILDNESMATLERFFILLYDKTSIHTEVNKARQSFFAKKSQNIELVIPSQAALRQHLLRALFQASIVWGQTLVTKPNVPSPEEWGWKKVENEQWKPYWTTLSQAKESCYELIHCNCKKRCQGNCKCFKADLDCTALCLCGGHSLQDS